MPELRKDPISQRWVVIAPDRGNRPIELSDSTDLGGESAFDPFAEGNEAWTPNEFFSFRNADSRPDEPGWRVRVVPNKYPAVKTSSHLERHADGIYERMTGHGTHEVIVECPHNEANLSRLSTLNLCEVIWAYQDRILAAKRDPGLAYALVFKNKGRGAGASLRHSHSQMIATPVVPFAVEQELQHVQQFFKNHGRSPYQEIIDQEIATGTRIVLETDDHLVFCPYASRFPFETWILPKQQQSHFEAIPPKQVEDLGQILKTVLCKLDRSLDDPPYNFLIHSAPLQDPELPHYRWRLEIFTRFTGVAGFEWGSGCFINHVPPENAAGILREALAE